MSHVFTYGSLMFAPVWEGVVRGRYASVAAQVRGYARFAVLGQAYPGCVVQAGAAVAGRLYLDVSTLDCRALDQFEGTHYARHHVLARIDTPHTTHPTQTAQAWMYVYLPAHTLSTALWDAAHFEAVTMAHFKATYVPTSG